MFSWRGWKTSEFWISSTFVPIYLACENLDIFIIYWNVNRQWCDQNDDDDDVEEEEDMFTYSRVSFHLLWSMRTQIRKCRYRAYRTHIKRTRTTRRAIRKCFYCVRYMCPQRIRINYMNIHLIATCIYRTVVSAECGEWWRPQQRRIK